MIGVIHLPALPGTAQHALSTDAIVERALADARTLHEAGFHALIVENYGDIPFVPGALPPASLAGMAVVADPVRHACPLPFGINALRNDALAALGIAAACGAEFIRVNVHCGVAATDSGMIEGRAAETLAYRRQLGADVAILADVHVKHAKPVNEPDIARCADDTAHRALAGRSDRGRGSCDRRRRVRERRGACPNGRARSADIPGQRCHNRKRRQTLPASLMA